MGIARNSGEWIKSEVYEVKTAGKEIISFIRVHNWKSTFRNAFRRKYWIWWLTLVLSIVASVLLSQYHTQIITAIKPYKAIIRHAKGAWLVPIVVLVIVSFPPLFGHELIILALGVIYTLPVAFAIACAGTFIGELACFYTAKYFLTNRAKSVEKKSIAYACLAKLMRDGGLSVSIVVRFSAIPGHLVTAIQSTIGISVWVYAVAAIVSLPKQFALVYLGNVFGQTSMPLEQWRHEHPTAPISQYYDGADSAVRRHNISLIVFFVTTIATLFAAGVIWMRVRKVRPFVLAEMEERRLQELAETDAGAEEVSETLKIDITNVRLQRPFLFSANSSNGSRVALLSAAARGRSGTTSSTGSSLNSPSLPHLPLYQEAATDYFGIGSEQELEMEEPRKTRRGSF